MIWPSTINLNTRKLEFRAWAARVAEPVKQATLEGVEWADQLDADFGHSRSVVYVFEATGKETPDKIAECFEAFRSRRTAKEKQNIALPRLLPVRSSVLYVGSCSNGAKTRLKHHVRTAPKRTSALQLERWYLPMTFRIHLRRYDVDRETLQIIEDSIASLVVPMFGKRGGNGR